MKAVEGEAPMFEKLELTRMAQALSAHAGQRLGLIARNVANADTPGYRAVDLPDFARAYQDYGGSGMRATRPAHFGGQTAGPDPVARHSITAANPNGNTVSLETEMVTSAEVRQSHQMALAIYRSTSDIIRTSLGRNR
jgi:flagellar basal-body rod protein FlgB